MAYKSPVPDFAPPVQLHALSLSFDSHHNSIDCKRLTLGAVNAPQNVIREKKGQRNCMWSLFGSFYTQGNRPLVTTPQAMNVPEPAKKPQRTGLSLSEKQLPEALPDQTNSRLLMLPLELRLMIYERVLCDGSRVQLNLEYKQAEGSKSWQMKYWHRLLDCHAFDDRGYLNHVFRDDTTRLLHYHSSNPDEVYNNHHSKPSLKLSMDIARTCRQLNEEVVQVLFQKRTFTLQTDLVLRKLNDFLPRAHTDMMRSVELVWELTKLQQPHVSHLAKGEYDSLWECLGPKALPALRELRVIVNPHHGALYQTGTTMDFTEAWLSPVVSLASSRRLHSFEVAIPKSYCARFRKDVIDTRAFSLRRMRDDLRNPTPAQLEALAIMPEDCPLSYQSFGPGEPMHDANCEGCETQTDENVTSMELSEG